MDRSDPICKDQESLKKLFTPQDKAIPKFIRKAFIMLEGGSHSDCVAWSEDGKAIVIKNTAEFAKKVLPCYFKHDKFPSFVRQLNMYSFKKTGHDEHDHAYAHPMFQRGKSELLKNIRRKSLERPQPLFSRPSAMETQESLYPRVLSREQLRQENLRLKMNQKALITQLQFVEGKIKGIRSEMATLTKDYELQQAKVDFLKKFIKKVGAYCGTEGILKATEQALYDTDAQRVEPQNYQNGSAMKTSQNTHEYQPISHYPNQDAESGQLLNNLEAVPAREQTFQWNPLSMNAFAQEEQLFSEHQNDIITTNPVGGNYFGGFGQNSESSLNYNPSLNWKNDFEEQRVDMERLLLNESATDMTLREQYPASNFPIDTQAYWGF